MFVNIKYKIFIFNLQAKKRQVFLEDTYGGSMKELDLILRNFQPEDKAKKPSKT